MKVEELTHAMDRYHLNILGLVEIRWKKLTRSVCLLIGLFQSWRRVRHEDGVGFLVQKDMVSAVLECRPVSSRLISIRLRAAPFNITILQVYATASGHDNTGVDQFYQQLQKIIDQIPKKDILVVQGDWNAKVGKDICGPTAMMRQMSL